MNGQAAYWLFNHINDGSLAIGKAPKQTIEWFEKVGLPMQLLRLLKWNWPQKDCLIGPVSICKSSDIPNQHCIDVYIRHKLLPVGSGPNGDVFAIDFSVESCPVGFVTHEEYYGEGDPRKFFSPAARSFESFLYRIAEGRYFPCDYYATGYFNDFLIAEATHEPFPPYAPKTANQGEQSAAPNQMG
jgi:hypothetical protein